MDLLTAIQAVAVSAPATPLPPPACGTRLGDLSWEALMQLAAQEMGAVSVVFPPAGGLEEEASDGDRDTFF